ncbi:M42 family metallopeptidase [Pseudalkalibacillus hwajinpoensis]|uniref:M42 family metallopeptidase n=1 Tax=Guptibacillus hwajinpoensis TaxID=208199 RepID=UPI00325B658A
MNDFFHAEELLNTTKDLVSIPSPSGYTDEVISWVDGRMQELGVATSRNNKGGLIATIEGENTSKHRMLTAHVDTLGAMVKEIKSDGRLRLSLIGGFRFNAIEGEYCEIITGSGKRFSGTILLHQTSVHVYKNNGDVKRDEQNMEVRLDERVFSVEDVQNLGIRVGDFTAFDPRVQLTESGFIKSRHLDDKASVALLLANIKKIKEENLTLPYTTHFLISNNEEIGYGGNSNIPPETVEYIAVDMGALGDGQASDEYTVSICAKDSSGPYHYRLREHLVKLAEESSIEYKLDIYPYYGSDASAAIRAGADVRHALIGPGIDASHAYERTHKGSMLHTANLIYKYLLSSMID